MLKRSFRIVNLNKLCAKSVRIANMVMVNRFIIQCAQNQLTVQVCTKSVNCTSVHKISLLYECTQIKFTVQVYTKPVYCSNIHKTSLLYKCTQNQFTIQVFTSPVYSKSCTVLCCITLCLFCEDGCMVIWYTNLLHKFFS